VSATWFAILPNQSYACQSRRQGQASTRLRIQGFFGSIL
jgi:hypothetical protein